MSSDLSDIFNVPPKKFRRLLFKLKKLSAAANSGWRNEHWLALTCLPDDELASTVIPFFDLIARLHMSGHAHLFDFFHVYA